MSRGIASQSLPWERLRLRLGRERAAPINGNPAPTPLHPTAAGPLALKLADALQHDSDGLRGLIGDVLETSTDPFMVVDADGAIVCANTAARKLGDRLGLPIGASASLEALLRSIEVVTAENAPAAPPIEAGRRLADVVAAGDPGSARPIFEVRCRARRAPNGGAVGWTVQLVELTALVETLRELETAKAHRESILRLLSHDMRSPQAAILATISHPDFSAAPANLRQIIERAARRSLHMVDSVVRQMRAETADYVFEAIDLGHLVEEAVDAVWSAAKSANIKVMMAPAPEEFIVSANRGMLTRALTDVLTNGIKFGSNGREITCALSATNYRGKPAVACSVSGRVRSASQGELIQIFSRFAASEKNEVGSMGDSAGLALLKIVVNRHGGTVACENVDGGRRTVTIILPRAESFQSLRVTATTGPR